MLTFLNILEKIMMVVGVAFVVIAILGTLIWLLASTWEFGPRSMWPSLPKMGYIESFNILLLLIILRILFIK